MLLIRNFATKLSSEEVHRILFDVWAPPSFDGSAGEGIPSLGERDDWTALNGCLWCEGWGVFLSLLKYGLFGFLIGEFNE